MKRYFKARIGWFGVLGAALGWFLFAAVPGICGQGLNGWEAGSAYGRLYQPSEFDSFKGHIQDIFEVVPMPGMAPGTALMVRDGDGDQVTVHLGPTEFIGKKPKGLKKGDLVKVKGVWAEIGGKEVFLASKVKKGDYFQLKVRRTKDGAPYWSMDAATLAREDKE